MSAELSLQTVVAELRRAGCVYADEEAALLIEAAARPVDARGAVSSTSAAREPAAARLRALVDRRVAGEPLEYVLGWAEFDGLRIRVDQGVFVPRLRTTLLVETAAAHLTARAAGHEERDAALVVDLCCGSGAAGAALAHRFPAAEVHAADIDPRAVACTRTNLAHPDRAHEGDLYDPLPPVLRGRVDVIVANAPYVPTDEIEYMPQEARLHEPAVALDGGVGGVDIQRRVAREAPAWLAPGGLLLIETSERQAAATRALVIEAGLDARVIHDDELDATLVAGRLP